VTSTERLRAMAEGALRAAVAGVRAEELVAGAVWLNRLVLASAPS